MKDFIQGLTAWPRGLSFIIRNPRLYRVAVIPFLISLTAGVASAWALVNYYPPFAQGLLAMMGLVSGVWFNITYYPLLFVGGLIVFAGMVYALYALHAVIAAPFYSALAERTLALTGKETNLPNGWREFFAMIRVSAVKGLLFLVCGLFLLVLSFIPVVNLLAFAGTMLLLAFDGMDYALEARHLRLRQRLRYAFRNKAQWFGLAAGLALTLLLPGLTLLVTPGLVVGAALIQKDTDESRAVASKNS